MTEDERRTRAMLREMLKDTVQVTAEPDDGFSIMEDVRMFCLSRAIDLGYKDWESAVDAANQMVTWTMTGFKESEHDALGSGSPLQAIDEEELMNIVNVGRSAARKGGH